ncbi:MAG: hypothetical protein ACLR8L_16205 [Oscillospiraceae bacterium]
MTKSNPFNADLYTDSYALSEAVLNAAVRQLAQKEYIWETDTMTGINWSGGAGHYPGNGLHDKPGGGSAAGIRKPTRKEIVPRNRYERLRCLFLWNERRQPDRLQSLKKAFKQN